MKIGLVITAAWSLLLILASLTFIGVFPFYPARLYDFTLPFVAHAIGTHITAVLGLVVRRIRSIIFWPALALLGSLVFSYHYAMSQWPGGDDGPGMGWFFIVGGGSYVALATALLSAVLVAISRAENK